MTRTVKIVIIVVLVVAAAAAVASIVGMTVVHHDTVGVRQMLADDGFRFPGHRADELRQMYDSGPRGDLRSGGWGAFIVLPWVSLALVIGLAVAMLLWRPAQPLPAAAGTGEPDAGAQWEEWHRALHAQGTTAEAHEAVTEVQAHPEAAAVTPAEATPAEASAEEAQAPEAQATEPEQPSSAKGEDGGTPTAG